MNLKKNKYWLIKGRRVVRKIVRNCVECKKLRAKPVPPLMANLPKERLQPFAPPFTNSGLDYFGPFIVVIGRRREKRYGCLFTCLTTRAVHLEMAYKLDANSFIMAFRRFIAIRGTPKVVFSDNGTNLAAGEKEMRENILSLDCSHLREEMKRRSINWRFSPPSAPHFGGAWERLVQSSKGALRAILQDRAVSDEVLITVFSEVMSLLNGRPLTFVSMDPDDDEPLTPNHFVLGRAHPHIPPLNVDESHNLSRRRWKFSQFIVDQYWKRWMREYVPNLIESRKWFRQTQKLQIGDRVLIVDENAKRGEWPVGKVVVVKRGDGNIVRTAVVQTKSGIYTRPVIKLCIISERQSLDNNGS